MFKFVALLAFVAVASAAPGFIAETHSIVQPAVLTKTAVVDTSASSPLNWMKILLATHPLRKYTLLTTL